jgi:hypothetical protein
MPHLPGAHLAHLDTRRCPPVQITRTRLRSHFRKMVGPRITCQSDQTRNLPGLDRMEGLAATARLTTVLMAGMIPDHLRAITGDWSVRLILLVTASDLCMAAGRPRECLAQLIDANGQIANSGSTKSELCEGRHETTDFHRCVRLPRGILGIVEMAGITASGPILEAIPYHLQWNLEESLQARHSDKTTLHTGATCHLATTTRTPKGTRTHHFAHRRL